MPGTRYRLARGRKDAHSLWDRAGANVGDGARTLFARLDAPSEQPQADADAPAPDPERIAVRLDALAARVRAGEWSDDLDQLLTALEQSLAPRE